MTLRHQTVPDGTMPDTIAQDDHGRPHVVGYIFLRDRIGWAILGLLVVQAALLGWIVWATIRVGNLVALGG